MPLGLKDAEIGGGIVRRRFSMNGESVLAGTKLTREELLAMPISNRNCLIRLGSLDIFPPAQLPAGERHVIHVGKGKFDVIVGVKLNSEPLSKDEADALAVDAN